MLRLTLIILLTFAFSSLALGSSPPTSADEIGRFIQQDELKTYRQLQEWTGAKFAASEFEDFPMTSDLLNISYRSPSKAFLYSMMIPGTGQLYNHSKFKAGVFMAVEVVSWVDWLINQRKGQSKTDDYNNFADRDWSAERYTNWLIETYGIVSDTAEFINEQGDPTRFTHHLPTTKTQQYYEMIGKYDQFRYGWSDTDYLIGKDNSPLRTLYLSDRATANDYFTKAKTGAIIAIANHLLSAFDAALSAKRYNSKQDTFSEVTLRARIVQYEGYQMPKLTLSYTF
ncbi:MAG: hypothetical protein E4G91_00555 [Candidatus Zixiibacteriota bacterium]|nr:MAG: hypothetical protein E4G91_00555 [candidate division Zixibacteria bacterium]